MVLLPHSWFYLPHQVAALAAALSYAHWRALASGGTLALNQYLERDLDARMLRTRSVLCPRPVAAWRSLGLRVAITASGLLYLALLVNPLSGLVTAVSVGSYFFLYTPLKQKTPFASSSAPFPGPAASDGLGRRLRPMSLEAWVLFAILFFWQIPHSLSIAVLYREDYARANFQLLPVVEPEGTSTGRQIVVHSLALLAVGLLPTTLHLAGAVYFVTAFVFGVAHVSLWSHVGQIVFTCRGEAFVVRVADLSASLTGGDGGR